MSNKFEGINQRMMVLKGGSPAGCSQILNKFERVNK